MKKINILLCVLAAFVICGCSSTYPYKGKADRPYYTFAATRKLLEDENNIALTRTVASPFLMLPETFYSPVTAYIDSTRNAPKSDGHVYLSYVGTRTILHSSLEKPYRYTSCVFACMVDTLWFPVAAVADVIYSITRDADPGLSN